MFIFYLVKKGTFDSIQSKKTFKLNRHTCFFTKKTTFYKLDYFLNLCISAMYHFAVLVCVLRMNPKPKTTNLNKKTTVVVINSNFF